MKDKRLSYSQFFYFLMQRWVEVSGKSRDGWYSHMLDDKALFVECINSYEKLFIVFCKQEKVLDFFIFWIYILQFLFFYVWWEPILVCGFVFLLTSLIEMFAVCSCIFKEKTKLKAIIGLFQVDSSCTNVLWRGIWCYQL